MTTLATAWKYPDWIYVAQKKMDCIDLTKFPTNISFSHTIISPTDNEYYPDWAIRVDVRIAIKDRLLGKNTSLGNPKGIYVYSAKDIEQLIYVEIERLMTHELRECFHIREPGNNLYIPFDPHSRKSQRIKYSIYDRVDMCRFYPSWRKEFKFKFGLWAKKKRSAWKEKLRAYWKKVDSWIKLAYTKPKQLN